MRVGDLVRRRTGSGDAETGRILDRVPGAEPTWLVTAGGRTYRDAETDLVLIHHPNRHEADS